MMLSKVVLVAIATMTVSPAFAQHPSKVRSLVRTDQDIAFNPNRKQFVHRCNQELVTSSYDSEDGPSGDSPSEDTSPSEDSPDVEDEPSVRRRNQKVVTSSSDSEDGLSEDSPSEDSPDMEDEPSARRRNQEVVASSSDSEDSPSEDSPDEDNPDEDSLDMDLPEEDTTQNVETNQSLQLLKTSAYSVRPPEEVSASGSYSKNVAGVFVATGLTAFMMMMSSMIA